MAKREPFNLSGMSHIYHEARRRGDPTLAFEVKDGRGLFIFLMFFSEEDNESKDYLYLVLGTTRVILSIKMYGSHRNGIFNVYINELQIQQIRDELQLSGGGGPAFDIDAFLGTINTKIPLELSLREKIRVLRNHWPHISQNFSHVVDQADKTILIGPKIVHLPKHPQDKTLRKLYLYRSDDADAIARIIDHLKSVNYTLAWTVPGHGSEMSLADVVSRLPSRPSRL